MKILLVRHVAVGDVLFTTPFFRLLRQRHPDATVDLYSMVRGVLEPLPGFGAHIPMSEGSMRKVLARGYDLIYWFSYEHSPELHLLDGYEQSTGLRLADRTLQWTVSPKERAAAATRLAGLPRPLIGFSPVSNHALRSLRPEASQRWIDGTRAALGGTVVLTSDRPLGLSGCLDLSGRLESMRELAAIVESCDAWLTVDSGPLHLAQALGIPAVALFGCTLPELRVTRPELLHVVREESLDCLGCYHRIPPYAETLAACARGDLACLERLELGPVLEALRSALERRPDPALLARVNAYVARAAVPSSQVRTHSIARTYQARIAALTRRPPFFYRLKRFVRNRRTRLTVRFGVKAQ